MRYFNHSIFTRCRGIIKEKGSGGTLGDIANHLSAQGNVTLDGQRDMLVEPPRSDSENRVT